MLSAQQDEALGRAVDRRLEETLDLLADLVAEPSVEGSAAIDRCLDRVANAVAPLARSIERASWGGPSCLIARFGHGGAGRRLILSGHVDVVPAEGAWTTPPFVPARVDGRVIGRGTCDMKGGVAAFVGSLHVLADSNLLDRCAVDLVITGDEEVGSQRGMIPLLEHGRIAIGGSHAICGEPTGLDVYLGNRGLVWLEITVHGRGGHAGLSHVLANPVPVAARLIAALHALPFDVVDERFDPPAPSLNVTRVDAGTATNAVNVIPDAVVLGVDRRLLPGEDPDRALSAIEALVENTVRAPYRAAIRPLRAWPPYAISEDEPVARAARDAVRATGRPGLFGMDAAANDSSWLDRAGIPTVLLGPGAPEAAHTTGESVAIAEVRDAIEIYARTAVILAGEERA